MGAGTKTIVVIVGMERRFWISEIILEMEGSSGWLNTYEVWRKLSGFWLTHLGF